MNNSKTKLKLLPLNELKKTGNVDHADWNYRFILGYIQRQRFKLILKLIGDRKFENILEIGYGSGVFIPQIAEFAKNIYGIDIHNQNNSIMELLGKYNIKPKLFSGSVEEMPFEDDSFDCIISISALEFVDNLDAACLEIKRVLKKNGYLHVVTPGYSKILDLGVKILTGKNARDDYGYKREKTIPILIKNFRIEKKIIYPRFNLGVKMYNVLQLLPLK